MHGFEVARATPHLPLGDAGGGIEDRQGEIQVIPELSYRQTFVHVDKLELQISLLDDLVSALPHRKMT